MDSESGTDMPTAERDRMAGATHDPSQTEYGLDASTEGTQPSISPNTLARRGVPCAGSDNRLGEIPLLIPSSYLVRKYGKLLRDKPWLLAQIDIPRKAEVWRLVHKKYFREGDRKEKIIESMLRLWPPEVRIPERRDWASWELGERLHQLIKVAILGVNEDFNSQEIGAEEDDDGLLDQALPLSVEEAARKDTFATNQSMAKAMRETSGGRVDGKILDIAWAHRRVFDPV